MLRQEAVEALSKLTIRKYRRTCCSTGKRLRQERRDTEVCAVCLDEFHNNQVNVSMQEVIQESWVCKDMNFFFLFN